MRPEAGLLKKPQATAFQPDVKKKQQKTSAVQGPAFSWIRSRRWSVSQRGDRVAKFRRFQFSGLWESVKPPKRTLSKNAVG